MRKYDFLILKESLNLEASVILCTKRFDSECDHNSFLEDGVEGLFCSIGSFAVGEELIIVSEGREYPIIITGRD